MKAPDQWNSSLAVYMVKFIAFKRMQGRQYREGAAEIKRFDAFLAKIAYVKEILDLDVLGRFAEAISALSHSSRMVKLSTVRQFSLYLHAMDPGSAVLPLRLVPRSVRSIRFYALSPSDVGQLMAASAILKPDNGIRTQCIRFLIGLIYTTGLRVSEALALTLGDVHQADSTLLVHRGKFGKERLVAMSPSTRAAMDQWLVLRSRYAGCDPSAPLLVTGSNRRLSLYSVSHIFRRLCTHCGLVGESPPRLHDLRHNYACACLARWRQEHENVAAMLPVLANAMGHADFHDTEIYLHINLAALEQASKKFKQHVKHKQGHQR